MRINAILLPSIFFIFFLGSWSLYKGPQEIKKATWLLGTWQNKTSKGVIYETWSERSDHELSGMSYFIQDQDTTVLEIIQIIQENDRLFYIPTVHNQNDALPVRFSSTIVSDSKMVFENKEHDFPQVITYMKITEDSLVASISGLVNGKERKQIFPMSRQN